MKNIRNIKEIKRLDFDYLKKSIFMHYTGSMFGIGCFANSKESIEKISRLKNRDDSKGYILLIPDISWLDRFGVSLDSKKKSVLEQYWPGDLTAILKIQNPEFSYLGIKNTIAFRVPKNKSLRNLIKFMGEPIISTSINKSGEQPLSNIKEIEKKYDDWFDFGFYSHSPKSKKSQSSTLIKFEENGITCLREGIIQASEIEESYKNPLITFLCTGNICRSPIAEYLFREKIKNKMLSYKVTSIGLLISGIHISKNSEIVLKKNGIDASAHISKRINRSIVRKSKLIITMTNKHKKKVIRSFPEAISKVFTLAEVSNSEGDVKDPYGLSLNFYTQTYAIINQRIDAFIESLNVD